MKSAKIIAAVAALGVMSVSGFATTVGYVTKTIAAGAAGVITDQFIDSADASTVGTTNGTITGVSAGTLTDSGASFATDFTVGNTIPFYVKINSGASEGRIFRITANTGTSLTLSPAPNAPAIESLTIATSTDTYEVFRGVTLNEFFALTDVLSGASFTVSDQIFVSNSGGFPGFFYNGTNWRNQANFGPNQDSVVIEPWGAIYYIRNSAATGPVSLVTSGAVSNSDTIVQLPGSGQTFIGGASPVDRTISSLGLQALTSWTSGASFTVSDKLFINSTGAFSGFFYNGSNWRNQANFGPNQDGTVIPAGTPVFIQKVGTTSSEAITISAP